MADSVRKIERTLSATKPKASDGKLTDNHGKWIPPRGKEVFAAFEGENNMQEKSNVNPGGRGISVAP